MSSRSTESRKRPWANMYARALGAGQLVGRTARAGPWFSNSIPAYNHRCQSGPEHQKERGYLPLPLQLLLVMSRKRLCPAIVTVLALTSLGPSRVWADPQASCSAGWEWVCSVRPAPPPPGCPRCSDDFVRVHTLFAEQEFAWAGPVPDRFHA